MRVMRVFAGNSPTTHEKCQRQKNKNGLKKPRYDPHHPQPETSTGPPWANPLRGRNGAAWR